MSHLVKRTYFLPQTTANLFEESVVSDKRSEVVTPLIQNFVEAKQRQQLHQSIIEGCAEMRDVYLEIESEYYPLEEDAHRALNKFEPDDRSVFSCENKEKQWQDHTS